MTKPIPWTTAEILEATKGNLLCGYMHRVFAGISIDSRRIDAKDVFVAIKGDVHDGHDFVGDVIAGNVAGLIIDQEKAAALPGRLCQEKGRVCVAVTDTTKALGDLAAFQRRRSKASVVAITGSNGKTTTRTMTAAVAAQCFDVLTTSGNLNNEIGLPLTLLNLNSDHQWAVVELGMNRPGEIERLGEICSPQIGLITNIGPAHLEGLGSVDAVMRAKGELLAKITPAGTAVLNADDPKLMQLADQSPAKVVLFGRSGNAQIRGRSILKKGLGLSFTLQMPSESIDVDIQTPGIFMVSNALAAAAVGYLLGASARQIKAGLESFVPVHGRLNLYKTPKGIFLIDDTYNANPGSMSAAIETLKSLKGGDGRKVMVIGDMLELGPQAASLHRDIGMLCAQSKISRIYATGKLAASVAAGARETDMDSGNIIVGTKEEIYENIIDWLDPGDWVLVKGSRSMAMEEIVEKLLNWAGH